MASLAEYNLSILAVLDEAPEWISAAPDPKAFSQFAGAFAKRYGHQITYYQIWHNVNIGDAWGGYADAYSYTELLALASQAIRTADSDARIVLGSLAPNIEIGEKNYAEDVFLEMLYAAGAGPYFDVAAVQPYGFNTGPEDRRVRRDVMNFSRVQLVRHILISHDDADKAIWGSNFGWHNLHESWQDAASIWGSVDEKTQAAYTVAAYERAAGEWPWMGLMCVNILQPRPSSSAGHEVLDAEEHWGFTLVTPNGEVRPVYKEIQAWTAESKGASSGYYPAHTPYASYEGNWTLGPQGADIGQSGDSATFDFTGTGLAITVRKGPYRAFLYVTIDGQPAPALPSDRDGQAYVVLYDPLAAIVTIPLAEGLPYGKHSATIGADRGWGQWAIADWRVSNAPNKQRYHWGLVIYGGLAILGGICLINAAAWFRYKKMLATINLLWQRCTVLTKAVISVAASALYLFAAWHMLIGDGLFRRLGDHSDWLALVLSSGLFYFSHWFVLTLIAGAIVAILVLLRPGLGLALTLFAAPLYLHPLSLFGMSFSLSELVLLPTVAGVLLNVVGEGHIRLSLRSFWQSKKRVFLAPILVFVFYSLLTSIMAEYRHEALREWRLVVLEPALFFFALIMLKMDRHQRLRILDAFVASALMVALVGLIQYFWLGDAITAEGGIRRLRSIYGSPNNVGLYLGRVFPLLIAFVFGLTSGDRKASTHTKKMWQRVQHFLLKSMRIDTRTLSKRRAGYALAVLPITLALVLSFSRGAIILGIPAALLTLGLLAGKTWRRITLVLLVLGVLMMIPIMRLPRFAGLFDLSGGTTGFRISLWYSSIQMIRDSPLFGVGLDNFLYAYRTRYVLPTAWEEFNLSHPHNVFLDYATRLGLPGLCLFLWLQVVFWREIIPHLKSGNPEVRAITLGIMASMVNFLAHGLVDASYFVIDLAYVYMLSFAVTAWLSDAKNAPEQY